MMASDMNWTNQLGNAFLAQQPELMDAVQRLRQKAQRYGVLRSNPQVGVGGGPYITIMPVDPYFIPVPYYDPGFFFVGPRPGFAISFGFGVALGAAFRPWGWGYNRFDWGAHRVIINNAPWGRTWVNRGAYVHPYSVQRYNGARPAERHASIPRNAAERAAPRVGPAHGRRARTRARARGPPLIELTARAEIPLSRSH